MARRGTPGPEARSIPCSHACSPTARDPGAGPGPLRSTTGYVTPAWGTADVALAGQSTSRPAAATLAITTGRRQATAKCQPRRRWCQTFEAPPLLIWPPAALQDHAVSDCRICGAGVRAPIRAGTVVSPATARRVPSTAAATHSAEGGAVWCPRHRP